MPDRPRHTIAAVTGARAAVGPRGRVAVLAPNHDPGRDAVLNAIRLASDDDPRLEVFDHLPHPAFRAHLKWLAENNGVFVGNSSAGLIDAPLLGCPSVDVGPRQAGRERPHAVRRVERCDPDHVAEATRTARSTNVDPNDHPYGDSASAQRIADTLARFADHPPAVRKRNAY